MKYNIIALFGESGAGKDTIAKKYAKDDRCHYIISHTTRPPRSYETNHEDYHFVTKEDFARLTLSGEMLEATKFREWFYGTSITSLDENKINLGVFNIAGIEALLQDPRLNVIPIRITVTNDKTRLIRCLNREEEPDCAEICRRYITDKQDFSDIPFEYTCLLNDNERTNYAMLDKAIEHLATQVKIV